MNRKKTAWWAVCFAVSASVMLMFASRTSPLYSLLMGDYGGNEASAVMLIGKYWLKGEIPYRDLFAAGGPVYFLIQAAGWFLGGRTGIWILEMISFSIFLIVIQKCIAAFSPGKTSFAVTMLAVPFYAALCSGGDSSSEWCLPFLAIGLWLVVRQISKEEFSDKTLFLLGIFCGLIMMTHIQSSGLIYGLMFWILGSALMKHDVRSFGRYLMLMLAGVLSSIFPFAVYFTVVGGMDAMISGALEYPIRALGFGFDTTKIIVHKMIKCFLVIPLLTAGINKIYEKEKKKGFCAVCASIGTILLLFCGDNQWYYYMSAVPCVLLGIGLWDAETGRIKRGLAVGACVVLGAGICVTPIKNYMLYLRDGVPEVVEEFMEDLQDYREEVGACRILPIDTDCSYLLVLDEKPAVRYFTDQTELSKYDAAVGNQVEAYVNGSVDVDILLTTERGWVGQEFERYSLVQVYCKKRGNLCVYLPNN